MPFVSIVVGCVIVGSTSGEEGKAALSTSNVSRADGGIEEVKSDSGVGRNSISDKAETVNED